MYAIGGNVAFAVMIFGAFSRSQIISIAPPATLPPESSMIVDHSFPSFTIQESSFPSFVGNKSSPSTFSFNLFQSITNRTGAPVVIRIAGTNGDASHYLPDQLEAVTYSPGENRSLIPMDIKLGPSFFEGFKQLPGISKWVFGAPFADLEPNETISQTREFVSNVPSGDLFAIEIGNEVDVYGGVHRNKSYSPTKYVNQFLQYANIIMGNISLPYPRIFQGPDLFSLTQKGGGKLQRKWSIQKVWEAGMQKQNLVKTASVHWYQRTFSEIDTPGQNIQATLMNHTYITQGISNYVPGRRYLAEHFPDVEYVFGEIGRNSQGGGQGHSPYTLGVFGSALWTLDAMMYLMAINVTRLHWSLGISFGYSPWHPITDFVAPDTTYQPSVRAPYYAFPLVGDLLASNTSNNIQVFPLNASQISTPSNVTNVNADNFAAYAVYASSRLAKLVLINFAVYAPSALESGSDRQVLDINLTGLPDGISQLQCQYLTNEGGATALTGHTYDGLSWNYPTGLATGETDSQFVAVSSGAGTVRVQATEAVLVTLRGPGAPDGQVVLASAAAAFSARRAVIAVVAGVVASVLVL